MFKKLFGGGASATPSKPAPAHAEPAAKPDFIAHVSALDTAIVFKHSSTCPVSWMADRQMQAFQAEHPAVPFYKVIVQNQRALSNQLADWTGIEHESPQIIVLRKGTVAATMSHGEVTADNVAEALNG